MKLSFVQKIVLVVLMVAAHSVAASDKAAQVAALEKKISEQKAALKELNKKHQDGIDQTAEALERAQKEQLAEVLTPFYEDLVTRLQEEQEKKTACSWGVLNICFGRLNDPVQSRVDFTEYQCNGLYNVLNNEKSKTYDLYSNKAIDKAKFQLLGVAQNIADAHREIWKADNLVAPNKDKEERIKQLQEYCVKQHAEMKHVHEKWVK